MEEKENKKKILILWLVPLLLLIILCLIGYIIVSQEKTSKQNTDYKTSGIQVAIGSEETKQSEQRMTKIIGDNLNLITSSSPYLYLQNDPSNFVYLQFDIYEGENLLYSSDLIEPNNMERVNIFKLLPKGPHNLEYHITSHKLDGTYEVLLSGIKQIKNINIQ